LAFPQITMPYLALVKVTFSLLGSFKKPEIRIVTNALSFIGSDTGNHDVILFASLEAIHTHDFDLFVDILGVLPMLAQVIL